MWFQSTCLISSDQALKPVIEQMNCSALCLDQAV